MGGRPTGVSFGARPAYLVRMDELSRLSQDLDPALSDQERAELVATGIRLQAARPLPAPAFRGDLKRRLLGTAPAAERRLRDVPRRPTSRPRAPSALPAGRFDRRALAARTLRARIAAAATSGAGLLAIAALGLAGIGPFAA